MKRSTTLIVTGLVLLFLALLYAIMPPLILVLYENAHIAYNPNNMLMQPAAAFVWNYWLCYLAGIGCLAVGVRELWKEK